jgi:2,5-diketo-D-gluconate reductase A
MKIPEISFADKRKIPQIGLGLWQVRDVEQFNTAFAAALEAGYRHFDTAQAYDNE